MQEFFFRVWHMSSKIMTQSLNWSCSNQNPRWLSPWLQWKFDFFSLKLRPKIVSTSIFVLSHLKIIIIIIITKSTVSDVQVDCFERSYATVFCHYMRGQHQRNKCSNHWQVFRSTKIRECTLVSSKWEYWAAICVLWTTGIDISCTERLLRCKVYYCPMKCSTSVFRNVHPSFYLITLILWKSAIYTN